MDHKAFYRGMLFELEKTANPAMPSISGANAQRSATPAGNPTAQANSTPTPTNAGPSVTQSLGKGLGTGLNFMGRVNPGFGYIKKQVANTVFDSKAKNFNLFNPNNGLGDFSKGYLQGDTQVRNQVNTRLADKSYGVAQFDADSGSIGYDLKDFQGKRFLNDAGSWISQNPGKAALGGAGLVALLSLLRGGGGQQQQQQPVVVNNYMGGGMQSPPRQTPTAVPQFL